MDNTPRENGTERSEGGSTGARRGSAVAGAHDEGKRLDVFLSAVTGISRSRVQSLISDGHVAVDGAPARKNHLMAGGEEVAWVRPKRPAESLEPEDIPLDIVFEDTDIVVVDKPAGMVMYPGLGHEGGTLINALLARYPDMAGVGGEGRPGVFHRLDRGTSGLVAVARTEKAYLGMVEMISARDVERGYIALVTGDIPAPHGVIDAPMGRSEGNRKKMAVRQTGGREAVTRFEVLERFPEGYTLVRARLETGRTHQIRVHFAYIGNPVAGDPEYSGGRGGRELGLKRQFLHACALTFNHPISCERLFFESDLPPDLASVLGKLRPAR